MSDVVEELDVLDVDEIEDEGLPSLSRKRRPSAPNPQTEKCKSTINDLVAQGCIALGDNGKPYVSFRTMGDPSDPNGCVSVWLHDLANFSLGLADSVSRRLNPEGASAVRLEASLRDMRKKGLSDEEINAFVRAALGS